MKTLSFIFILFGMHCHSQQREILDTIYSNQFHNVALFFPSTIQQGIVGHENFTFSYNQNAPQHLGLLKAFPGTVSSLLVITSDGYVYSYFLKYADELPHLNYFIGKEASIGKEEEREEKKEKALNLEPVKADVPGKPGKEDLSEAYYQSVSRYLLRTSAPITLARDRDSKVVFKLKQITYRGDKTFIVLEITNKSALDFRIDYLELYFASGNKGRKSSYQRISQEPLYRYGQPEVVQSKSRVRFVLVFPKFAPGKNRHLEIQIGEETGGRTLKLKH